MRARRLKLITVAILVAIVAADKWCIAANVSTESEEDQIAKEVDQEHEYSKRRAAEEELEQLHRIYADLHLAHRVELMHGLKALLANKLNQSLPAILSNAQAARRLLGAPKRGLGEAKTAIEVSSATARAQRTTSAM